jgi:hypothetical protein
VTETYLRIYTVDSTWIHRTQPLGTLRPYPRVVALEVDGHRTDGRFELATDPKINSFRVPEHVAATALSFFDRYVAGNDVDHPSHPERIAGLPGGPPAERYNSAMLALTMADVHFDGPADAEHVAAQLTADYGFQGRPVVAGEIGAVRRMATGANTQYAVGLGSSVHACLTIAGPNGNMAAPSYGQLMHEFAGPGPAEFVSLPPA